MNKEIFCYLPSFTCHYMTIRLQVQMSFTYFMTLPSYHTLNKTSLFLSQGVCSAHSHPLGIYGWLSQHPWLCSAVRSSDWHFWTNLHVSPSLPTTTLFLILCLNSLLFALIFIALITIWSYYFLVYAFLFYSCIKFMYKMLCFIHNYFSYALKNSWHVCSW